MKTLIILISSMLLICCSNSNLSTSQIKDDFQIDSFAIDEYVKVDTVWNESAMSEFAFHNILGCLNFSMPMEDAISGLSHIGINGKQLNDSTMFYYQKITWEVTTYDYLALEFSTDIIFSEKYLSCISFGKIFRNLSEAESLRDQLLRHFMNKKDIDKIESRINESGLKMYVLSYIDHIGEVEIPVMWIYINVSRTTNDYLLSVYYFNLHN